MTIEKRQPFLFNSRLERADGTNIECLTTINELIGNSGKLPDNFDKFELAIHIATREIQKIPQDNVSASSYIPKSHLGKYPASHRLLMCLFKQLTLLDSGANSSKGRDPHPCA